MTTPCENIAGPCRETLRLMPENTADIMYTLFAISSAILILGFAVKIRRYLKARPEVAWDHLGERLSRLWNVGILQARTWRKQYAGPMHALIFWGFLVLFAGTVLVAIDLDVTLHFFQVQFLVGDFYLGFEFLLDFFGILFLIGIGMAIRRRLSARPAALYNKVQDVWNLGLLGLLGVQGFLVEALRFAYKDAIGASVPWGPYSFAGYTLSRAWPSSVGAASTLEIYRGLWWFHAFTLFVWLAAIPYTKMQHVLASPANIFFSTPLGKRAKGELDTPFNLQKALETGDLDLKMGAQKLEDFTWRQVLSLDACTECGRCQEVCPAYAAGRPLSPMKVVLDLRAELSRKGAAEWGAIPGEAAAQEEPGNQLVDRVIENQTLWSCVTCRACQEACPVMIEHIPLILDMRRGLVMESRLDGNQTRLLNNLANTGNAYGFPASDRDAWAEGLEIPRLADVADPSSLEALYWVGCSGSYDQRNIKVSRSLARVMKAANVRFAILGKEERCNGDPARRLGEEGRFQELVMANVETLKKYNLRKVVTQCPHCFNTLKNEYRRFGIDLDVEHHAQFIERLQREGRLPATKPIEDPVTYHDPCYLGRHNDVYEEPRNVVKLLQIRKPTEMPRHGTNSFCCGAGGANMWFEVKQERERMSNIRFREAQATGAKRLATACPFCMTMFDDAARVIGDGSMRVQDIAEMVDESLQPRP